MIDTSGLRRTFRTRHGEVEAVAGVDLHVEADALPEGSGMSATTVTRPRGEYAAPVAAGVRSGRLVFERGTANDMIVVEPDLADLFVARFDGVVPRVETTAGTVRIRQARTRRNRGRIALTGRLPWSLELHGGAARLRADLGGADITEITVAGGASHVDLALPTPTGCVPICFGGGVSNVSVLRPKHVPVRLSIGGGAARIALDDQRFGAIGGPIALSSGCADGAAGSYDIHIAGGAHALVIATY